MTTAMPKPNDPNSNLLHGSSLLLIWSVANTLKKYSGRKRKTSDLVFRIILSSKHNS